MIRVNNLSSVYVENSISRLLSDTSNQLVEFQHPFDIMSPTPVTNIDEAL